MKTIAKNTWLKWLPLSVLIVIATSLIIFIIANLNNGDRFTVVKLNTKEACYNISKGFIYCSFDTDSLNGQALLAEKGDLLMLGDYPYYYDNPEEDSIDMYNNSDSLVYINGNLNSIVIDSEKDLLPCFKQMKDAEMLTLKTICIKTKIPGGYFPYLEKIAKVNPHIGIRYLDETGNENTERDIKKLAALFSPKFAMMALTQKQLGLISHWKDLELLYLDIKEEKISSATTSPVNENVNNSARENRFTITETLTALPALKQCMLICNDFYILNNNFFIHNPQIERLTIMPLGNIAFLRTLPRLKQLNLFFDKLDITGLGSSCRNLHVLNLKGEKYTGIYSLDSLKNLTWLGLPINTTQRAFNDIVLKQRSLQVLEMHGNNTLKNLQPLTQLHQLKGLIIEDTLTDNKTLEALKHLRYLSLPKKSFNDSANMIALKKALPGCIIVPNSGACLGSGWLLLLIPLVLLFRMFKNIYTQHTGLKFQNNKT